jgi:hypothetical protein
MSKRFKHLQLKTLDQHLAEIKVCERPSDGWIGSIRKSIGMSVSQLAKKIGIAQQSLAKLEKNEVDGTITIKSLRKVAEGMNCKLVYALVPNEGSLEDIVKKQAIKKASGIVNPVSHTMMLEAQEVGNKDKKIQEVASELAQNLNSKLWE